MTTVGLAPRSTSTRSADTIEIPAWSSSFEIASSARDPSAAKGGGSEVTTVVRTSAPMPLASSDMNSASS